MGARHNTRHHNADCATPPQIFTHALICSTRNKLLVERSLPYLARLRVREYVVGSAVSVLNACHQNSLADEVRGVSI